MTVEPLQGDILEVQKLQIDALAAERDALRAALQQVRDILRGEVGDRPTSELAAIMAAGYGQWPLFRCVIIAENALSGTPVIDVKRVALEGKCEA